MPLADAEIREVMIKSLGVLIDDIRSQPSPKAPTGTEIFGRDGVFGDKETGQERYWLSALIVADQPVVTEQVKAFLRQYGSEKAD